MARSIPLERHRNIGILASQDAGRTTTTERILAVTRQNASARAGAAGTWSSVEDARSITITSAATSCEWRDHRINIVELPAGQSASAGLDVLLAVLDGVIVVLDGAVGVTAKAEVALATARRSDLPRLVFVNKLDVANTDLSSVVASLELSCTAQPVLMQLPLGSNLHGLIDLVEMKASVWSGAGIDTPAEDQPIPQQQVSAARAARSRIVSALGTSDHDISSANLRSALHGAVVNRGVSPILCGSAFRNRGIAALLDAIVDYMPAPSEIGTLAARNSDGVSVSLDVSEDESFVGVAFRKIEDAVHGDLAFVRIYAGRLSVGDSIWNTSASCPEQVSRIVRVGADAIEEIEEAGAGDIVALVGLKQTNTGDTLCDPDAPVVLERVPMAPVPASAGHVKH